MALNEKQILEGLDSRFVVRRRQFTLSSVSSCSSLVASLTQLTAEEDRKQTWRTLKNV